MLNHSESNTRKGKNSKAFKTVKHCRHVSQSSEGAYSHYALEQYSFFSTPLSLTYNGQRNGKQLAQFLNKKGRK